MKIKFVNGHEYPYDRAVATERTHIAGQMRSALEVTFSASADPIAIMGECTEENLETIVLINEELDIENTYSGYTFVCFAGEKEGKAYIKLATGNADQRIINIITGVER